jgi:hypothetical protein
MKYIQCFRFVSSTSTTHKSYQGNLHLMNNEQDPRENIGKPYERGMFPYGGGVGANGEISFVVSREEYLDKMERLKSLL